MKKTIYQLFGMMLCCMTAFSVNAQVPTSGLLHRFQFNNYSLWNDAGTTQFMGSAAVGVGTATNRHGHPNSSVLVSNYIRANVSGIAPLGNNPRTFSLWINPQTIASDNVIFAYGTSSNSGAYGLAFKSDQVTNFGYSNDVSYNQSNLFQTNQWYHLAVTYTGTMAIIYLNGKNNRLHRKCSMFYLTNRFLYIGSFLSGAGQGFNGFLDDLLIYNRALTATEISQIYNCSSEKPLFTQVTPICLGKELAPLPTTSDNGITGTWSPATMNNTATTTYTFTPTLGQECEATTTTMTVAIHPANVTPTFSFPTTFCGGVVNPLPTISDNEAVYRHKNSGYIMMRKEEDDKRGLMDKNGRVIFPAEYKVMSLVGCDWLADSKPTMLMFGKDGKYGLMQLGTEKMTPMQFESILTHGYQQSYAVKMNVKWAFINENFEEITPYKYTNMGWSDDNYSFWCELNGTKKLIDASTGKEGSIYTGEKPKENSGSSNGNSNSSSKSSNSASEKNEPAKKEVHWTCAYCSKSETRSTSSGSPSSNGCTGRANGTVHMWRKQ